MKEEKVNEIIVTFADYVENYYDQNSKTDDVSTIVNEHFDEFIDWAYDEFVIDKEDREILKGNPDPELRDSIKKEVVVEFLMIVRVREYAGTRD
ncbi:MAG: hypothetical protein P1P86_16025 [Bacteroidales bacterium]|nr:hypothetical protein [Bacteroidales bacterium]